jgi:hypothetical protein
MTTTTTIAVPTSCAALCTKLAELAQRIDDQLAQAAGGAALDYGSLEQHVADALGEVERGLHAQVLARLDIDVPAIRVWGDEYRRIGRFESDYHTLAGTVRVMRTVYRKAERNGDTLDPVSVRAGVVADGWLPRQPQPGAADFGGDESRLSALPAITARRATGGSRPGRSGAPRWARQCRWRRRSTRGYRRAAWCRRRRR